MSSTFGLYSFENGTLTALRTLDEVEEAREGGSHLFVVQGAGKSIAPCIPLGASKAKAIVAEALGGKGATTKGGRTRKPKDPNAPKHAMTSYIFFTNDFRAKVDKEKPDATFAEKNKRLGEMWQKLPDSQKAKYIKMAENDKKRFVREMEIYEKGGKSALSAHKPSTVPAKASKVSPQPKSHSKSRGKVAQSSSSEAEDDEDGDDAEEEGGEEEEGEGDDDASEGNGSDVEDD